MTNFKRQTLTCDEAAKIFVRTFRRKRQVYEAKDLNGPLINTYKGPLPTTENRERL